MNISACVSGRGQLVVGDYEGMIYMLTAVLSVEMYMTAMGCVFLIPPVYVFMDGLFWFLWARFLGCGCGIFLM